MLQAARCAYVILIMATYWMTEAIPIAVTALLPIALMPWLGVIPSAKLCSNYLKVSQASWNASPHVLASLQAIHR